MRKYKQPNDLTIDFWPSFTDVLLSVVLVLIFVISLLFITQTGLVGALSEKESALAKLSRQLANLESSLTLSRQQSDKLEREMSSTSAALDASRSELDRTRSQLSGAMTGLTTAEANLTSTVLQFQSVQSQNEASKEQIEKLTSTITEYLKQVQTLGAQLNVTKEELTKKDTSLADLNASVKALSDQVSRLNSELNAAKEQVSTQKLELGKLFAELENRNKEIARLRDFEKYRSEFLAKLAAVFKGVADIRAVGDRFIFQGEVLFPSGRADLSAEGRQVLDKLIGIYKALESKIPADSGLNIQIQGHTDTDPIHTVEFPSNWELSSARATQVVRYLTQAGIPQNKLSSAGYSEYYPVAKGAAPEAKRQNRRIEIFFTRR